MQTKFNENASFDLNNRNNLIEDFYDFYYLIELEKEKVMNDKLKTPNDKDKLSYYDILTEGYELLSIYEENIDKTEYYQDWLVMFDNLIQESYFKSESKLNNN